MARFRALPAPTVFLPTVAYAWQVFLEHHYCVWDLLTGVHAAWTPYGNCQDGIARARNNLVGEFLKTDSQWVLWLDADQRVPPAGVERLLAHAVLGGLDVVAGCYAKKGPLLSWVLRFAPGAEPDPATGLVECEEVGYGFMLAHRRVYEAMRDRLDIRYENDPAPGAVNYDYHPMGVRAGRYESEDWAWCRRARELGFRLWADTTVHSKHIGYIHYPLAESLPDEAIRELARLRFGVELPARPAAPPFAAA
jgi:hypothetical protein